MEVTCCFTHAADVHLQRLDSVQKRFLDVIGIDPKTAFAELNLAPLGLRRDIANLGIILRAISGRGPAHFKRFFVRDFNQRRRTPRRSFHRFQVLDSYRSLQRDYINRSTLGYISTFNLLPERVFEHEDLGIISVSDFQHNLSSLAKEMMIDMEDWDSLYSPRLPIAHHPLNRLHL